MNKLRILLSLVIVAGAVLFAIRRHSLRELKVEQARLLERSTAKAIPPSPTPAPSSPGPAASELSADERSELLRLRGMATALRRDLSEETNQIARLSRPSRSSDHQSTDEPIVSRAQAQQKLALGRQWMVAIVLNTQTNRGQLPATMAEIAGLAGTAGTNDDFELVQNGRLHFGAPNMQQRTIILREKKPWRGTNDRWNRTYVFQDGHAETAASDTQDFTEWEEKVKTRKGRDED